MCVLWVGGHILVSDWQNSRQSYLSTQTSQSKISVREELENNETEGKYKANDNFLIYSISDECINKAAKNAFFLCVITNLAVSIVNW